MTDGKITSRVRQIAEARGWKIVSLHQPQHLFRANGRRHSRVADPADPWQATVANGPVLEASYFRTATGPSPDAAVLTAIPPDLKAALRRCENAVDNLLIAVDSLRDCLQK